MCRSLNGRVLLMWNWTCCPKRDHQAVSKVAAMANIMSPWQNNCLCTVSPYQLSRSTCSELWEELFLGLGALVPFGTAQKHEHLCATDMTRSNFQTWNMEHSDLLGRDTNKSFDVSVPVLLFCIGRHCLKGSHSVHCGCAGIALQTAGSEPLQTGLG